PLIVAFIDQMRAEGHAVESICAVLRQQGCQVAARTYRIWKQPDRSPAVRTIIDAHVEVSIRDIAWTRCPKTGGPKLTPEGLYGRRKMTALVRRQLPETSFGAVDRAMKALRLSGIRRSKGVRTTIQAKDGKRAGDQLDRNFSAPAPNRTWVMDLTYVRSWAGWVYTAFVVDVYAQLIIGWHTAT